MKRTGQATPTITLVPVGRVPIELLRWLREQLDQVLHQPVTIGTPVSLPTDAFNPLRQQYLGDTILASLRALPLPKGARVVALVDADCYTPGLNFIFGQAARGGPVSFVALPRLRQSFYGLPEDTDLFRQRVLKEVVHELGHTWNIPHCPDVRCVMHFSNTLQDTDAKGVEFCPRCARRLGRPTQK